LSEWKNIKKHLPPSGGLYLIRGKIKERNGDISFLMRAFPRYSFLPTSDEFIGWEIISDFYTLDKNIKLIIEANVTHWASLPLEDK